MIKIVIIALVLMGSLLCPEGAVQASTGAMNRLETEHFVVKTDCDAATLRWIASRLEAFRSTLDFLVSATMGTSLTDRRIEILLFEHARDFMAHAKIHAPALRHNGGFYDGATRTVVAFYRSNPLRLLLHEVVHAALGDVFEDAHYRRYAKRGWPVWFDEGFAEYAASYHLDEGQLGFSSANPARLATLEDAFRKKRFTGLQSLLGASPEAFSQQDMQLWYAEAWGLVDLLLGQPDLKQRVPLWIARIRKGEHGTQAFKSVFGADLAALESELLFRTLEHLKSGPRQEALFVENAFDAWTIHEGGQWRRQNDVVDVISHGERTYFTRDVLATQGYGVEFGFRPLEQVTVGLVLGHHGLNEYCYHTAIQIGANQLTVRHIEHVDTSHTVASHSAPMRVNEWNTLRVEVRRGGLSIGLNDQHILDTWAGGERLSLVGFYVDNGHAQFRSATLSQLPNKRPLIAPLEDTEMRPRRTADDLTHAARRKKRVQGSHVAQ